MVNDWQVLQNAKGLTNVWKVSESRLDRCGRVERQRSDNLQ